MASYHCSAKVGAKGSGGSHSEYISREGKYSKEKASRYEDLEATGHGNMPAWAEESPGHFWHAADEYERANGSVYRELVVALPRELTPDQRQALVLDFIQQEIGDRHAYQWAIHTPRAALDGGEQPHAHIMYSERIRDGIERDPAQYFKRANKAAPERGGCAKASGGKSPAELKAELLATRERWANVQNAHLERHGHEARVDHRSLKDQGIDREPEKHIGAKAVQRMAQADISALLERRAAEGELERSNRAVGLIDLSGDLAAAKRDQVQQIDQAESIDQVQARHDAVVRQIQDLAESRRYDPQPIAPDMRKVETDARNKYVSGYRAKEIAALGAPPEKGGLFGLKAKAYEKSRAAIEEKAEKLDRYLQGNEPKAVQFRADARKQSEDTHAKEMAAWQARQLAAQRKRDDLVTHPQHKADSERLATYREQQKAQDQSPTIDPTRTPRR